MYFYFSADFPIGIKLNGIYYGIINGNIKGINICEPEKTLVELLPLNGTDNSISFLLDDVFLSSPKNACVTDLKGGYLINFYKNECSDAFNIIAQEKFPDAIITLFNDNGLKLSIETPNSFYADNFSFFSKNAKIERFNLDGFNMIAINFDDKILALYGIDGEIKKVFFDTIKEFSFDKNFCTIKSYKDIAKHGVKIFWGYNGEKLFIKEKEITCSKKFIRESIPSKIIPYAFLEEFLIGGDFSFYLTDNVRKNSDKLNGYLGDFIGIMPPPRFRNINEVGLIYKAGDNLYKVEYATFTLINDKIDNIIKI